MAHMPLRQTLLDALSSPPLAPSKSRGCGLCRRLPRLVRSTPHLMFWWSRFLEIYFCWLRLAVSRSCLGFKRLPAVPHVIPSSKLQFSRSASTIKYVTIYYSITQYSTAYYSTVSAEHETRSPEFEEARESLSVFFIPHPSLLVVSRELGSGNLCNTLTWLLGIHSSFFLQPVSPPNTSTR